MSDITDADFETALHTLEQRFDVLCTMVLSVRAERDELLKALRALYDAARTEIDPSPHLIVAMMAARLAIVRAEETR